MTNNHHPIDPRDRNNVNFKKIMFAIDLRTDELQEIMRHSGMAVSNDRINRWKRNPSAGAGRYSAMTDDEFDAFCNGLVEWSRATDRQPPDHPQQTTQNSDPQTSK